MRSSITAITLLTSLAACSGGDLNPVTSGPSAGEETGSDSGSPANDSAVTTGTTTRRLQGDVTGITLNADNTLTIDNLPFDGPEGTVDERYTYMGLAAVEATGNPFQQYESGDETAETNRRKYFAVYGAGTYTTASAVATGDYNRFGWGGAQYTRNGVSAPDIARDGEAVYEGNYAGVRVSTYGTGSGDVTFTTATATIEVDFLDFETTGAIEGTIGVRNVYDTAGNFLGTLPSIALATASADDQGFIFDGSATSLDRTGTNAGDTFETGSWEGAFAGPNSEEIVGLIVITGPASETGVDAGGNPDPDVVDTFDAQETGVFIATDP
ncbi:hypothetical protein FHY55_07220 [Oceanicola sp. D3]|uniref:hypothetical protein n=1 Tax=Oceanicola sp. D3 TaxID=2587163 RepID=UPI00112496A8|nr:hypothetical protein [Oceanicola sp. D3]QDC09045.1 hypothetical protein FHY55_07220 [Oceanicola sp. D3]